TVAAAQWRTLGPMAVLYTASVIQHFIDLVGEDKIPERIPTENRDCLQAKVVITQVRSGSSADRFRDLKIGDTVIVTFEFDQSTTWLETFTDHETLKVYYGDRSSVAVLMPDKRTITGSDIGLKAHRGSQNFSVSALNDVSRWNTEFSEI